MIVDRLLRRYWKPVYCYLRHKGYSNENAKDLTQGFFETVASLQSAALSCFSVFTVSAPMQRIYCFLQTDTVFVTLHINGYPLTDMIPGAHPVYAFLHLAMSAVRTLHRVGGCRQERIVQKG